MSWHPFKSKTKIYVSSSSINIHGDFESRGSYLVTTIIGGVLGRPNTPLAESFMDSYLKSPGIAYPNWVHNIQDNNLYDLPKSTLVNYATPTNEKLENTVPDKEDFSKVIENSTVNAGDFNWWVQRYILENMPNRFEEDWDADIDNNSLITITFPDESTVSFTPDDFYPKSNYLYILYHYTRTNAANSDSIIESVPDTDELPDLTSYTEQDSQDFTDSIDLDTVVTTVKSYSDGRPDETTTETTTETVDANRTETTYTKSEYETDDITQSVFRHDYTLTATYGNKVETDTTTETTTEEIEQPPDTGDDSDGTGSDTTPPTDTESTGDSSDTLTDDTTTDPSDSGTGDEPDEPVTVTVTTTVTTKTDKVVVKNSWDVRDKVTSIKENTPSQLFIYRVGSNENADIESLVETVANHSTFFPVIPLRIDNTSILSSRYASAYNRADTIYRLLADNQLDTLVRKFEDTDSIGDIDYGALHFGIALNNPRRECRQYLMSFFQKFSAQTSNSPTTTESLLNATSDYAKYRVDYQKWVNDVAAGTATEDDRPLPPSTGGIVAANGTSIRIHSNEASSFFDVRLAWDYVEQGVFGGVLKENDEPLNIGDIKVSINSTAYDVTALAPFTNLPHTVEAGKNQYLAVVFSKQISDTQYLELRVGGLDYKNYIYHGKYTELSGNDGVYGDNYATEDTSFIIPLELEILESMTLVERAQVCSDCQFITANAYKKVKKHWYQTGWFKIVFVIAVIVITFYFGPVGFEASTGVLGTSAAVGAALGFAGTAALIAGTAANAIAAIVIAALIDEVATDVLGDKIGTIVAAIASIYVNRGLTSMNASETGTFAFNISEISAAQLTLYGVQMSNAVMHVYTEAKMEDLANKSEDAKDDYEKELESIESAVSSNLSPYQTDANINGIESRFIYAKLQESDSGQSLGTMTGADIVEITQGLIDNFAALGTKLNN